MANKALTHLSRHQIDDKRWNEVIQTSLNARPYALTWYLDAVSPHWEALILGDYEAVMPLPAKRKFGFRYYVQPLWTQQLGIFSPHPISAEISNCFWKKMTFSVFAMKVNDSYCRGKELPNLILPLEKDYAILQKDFHNNTQRNIRKALFSEEKLCQIKREEFLDFWKSEHPKESKLFAALEELSLAAVKNHAAQFYACKKNGALTAAVMTIETCNRIVYLAPVSNAAGKEDCAMFVIIDNLIRQNAGTMKVLDFEGSQIPGVRRFYEGFGAQLEPYYLVEHNHPHWLVNLLHR